MNLGLVGSRNFHNYEMFKEAILKILRIWEKEISDIDFIVSGGASGTDTLAERFTKEYRLPMKIFYPEWDTYGKKAGILRNSDIVSFSTRALPNKEKGLRIQFLKNRFQSKFYLLILIDKTDYFLKKLSQNKMEPIYDQEDSYDDTIYCDFCGEEVEKEFFHSKDRKEHWDGISCHTCSKKKWISKKKVFVKQDNFQVYIF